MSRNSCRDNLQRHAPRFCRTGKSSHRVHGESGASRFLFVVRSVEEAGWSAEFISQPAFHNALCGREPGGQAIGPRFLPAVGYWCEPPLFTLALEAEPAPTEFARDGHAALEWGPSPLRRTPAVHSAPDAFASRRGGPPVSLSSLRSGRRHQPHFPPLAPRVEKRPITHRRFSVAVCAPMSVLVSSALQGGCHKAVIPRKVFYFLSAKRT